MAARHNPRCPLCGAPTRALAFRDAQAWSCTDCEALTVEATAARQLLGTAPPSALLEPTAPLAEGPWAPTAAVERPARLGPPPAPPQAPRPVEPRPPPPAPAPAPKARPAPASLESSDAWFEAEQEEPRAGRPRPRRRSRGSPAAVMLVLAASVALLVLALPAAVVVYRVARDRAASQRVVAVPAPVALAETLGGPAPPVVLPAPEPVEEAVEEPVGEPEPEPARAGPSGLVAEGWDLVEGDPRRAAEVFQAALRSAPGDPEAQYGLGYAMLQAGDRAGAGRWLCGARAAGGAELRREVQSLLDHHQLTCSP